MLTYENLPQGKGHFFLCRAQTLTFLIEWTCTNAHTYSVFLDLKHKRSLLHVRYNRDRCSFSHNCIVDCNSRLMHQNEQKEADSPGRCCLKACSPGWLWNLWSYTWSRSWANWHRPPETSNRGRRIKARRHNRASSFVCARLQLDSNSKREQSNKNSPVFYFGTYGRFLIIWLSNMRLFSQV